MAKELYQLRFHGGNQQRYFEGRRELLECILRIAGQSPDPIFEVWGQAEPVRLSDGWAIGKQYRLLEVFDLTQDEVLAGLIDELNTYRVSETLSDG